MGLIPDPLHPAVVHFPIALAMTALLFEVLGRGRRLRRLADGGPVLLLLAAVGAVAAVLTGKAAHDAAVVPAGARALLESHEQLGQRAMWVLIALAVVRLVLAARGWYDGWRAWGFVALLAAAAGLVGYNGHLGGRLVFDHGVGTTPSLSRQASPGAGG